MKKNICWSLLLAAMLAATLFNPLAHSVSAQDNKQLPTAPSDDLMEQLLNNRGRFIPAEEMKANKTLAGGDTPAQQIDNGSFLDEYETLDWTAGTFSKFDSLHGQYDIYVRHPLNQDALIPITQTWDVDEIYPRLSRDSNQVIYVSDETGNAEIYKVSVDGGQRINLTNDAANDYAPVWSSDNKWIAYVRTTKSLPQIFIMDSAGGNKYQLTLCGYGCYQPSFSPDGKYILYVRVDNPNTGDTSLMIADRSGATNRIALNPNIFPYPATPSWSPNGEMIAFSYMSFDPWDIRVAIIDLNGNLLNDFSYYLKYGQPYYLIDILINGWSPDSKYLATTSVFYYYYWGYLDFSRSDVQMTKALGTPSPNFYDDNFELGGNYHPDVQSVDGQPPRTSLFLNNFSRFQTQLEWNVDPTGLAKVVDFQIQSRDSGSGIWQNVPNPAGDISEWTPGFTYSLPTGEAGTTKEYRARAKDIAGRWEEFPLTSGGDDISKQTTFYDWNIEGIIFDNRNRPVGNQVIDYDRVPVSGGMSEADGYYHTLIGDSYWFWQDVEKAGFGDIPYTSFSPDRDHTYDIFLQPASNLIINGEFEAGDLAGWTTAGGLPVQASNGKSHSGNSSVVLGEACDFFCLTEPDWVVPQYPNAPTIIYDKQGTLYTVVYADSGRKIQYREEGIGWSQPKPIDGLKDPIKVTISPTGRFYAIFQQADYLIYGYYRDPGGDWSPKFLIGSAPLEYDRYTWRFVADYENNLHFIFTLPQPVLHYLYNIQSGEFTGTEVNHIDEYRETRMHLAVLPDNRVVVAGNDSVGLVSFIQKSDGTFSAPVQMQNPTASGGNIHLFSGANGYPIMVWVKSNQGIDSQWFIQFMDKQGNWSMPVLLHAGIIPSTDDVTHCPDGSVLISSSWEHSIMRWTPEGDLESYAIPSSFAAFDNLYCDADNNPAFLLPTRDSNNWSVHALFEGKGSGPAGTAEVSQQVSIPADLHQPTLSFAFHLANVRQSHQTALEVLVRDQNSIETSLLTLRGSNAWRQEWADLGSWAGQTVTIIFRLNQAANEPTGRVWLDGIAIGGWTTPIINSIEPNRITELDQAPILTIHGENFMEGLSITFNGIPLSDGQLVETDTSTIKFYTPADLPFGCSTIKVTNPGGASAERRNAVCYQRLLFLPLVNRN